MEKYAADAEILVIAHSAEAAADLHLSVVSSKGSWFGIKRFTLNVLASRLAQHAFAASATAPASNLSFTAVVARAIHSLQTESKLSYFAPVATSPGFPIAVAKTLEELRMNEVDPESLARLARGGKDLAAIASLVEQELKESKLSDRAALFRAAIDSITSPENAAYLGLPLLLLDVAVRSRLENTLIRELAALSPDVLATAPFGDEQTITSLEESLQCKRNNERANERVDQSNNKSDDRKKNNGTANAANSLSFAKQNLFEDSAPPVNPLDQSLRVNSWPGEPRECVEIVRSIQAEAAQGVPFDQMAVLLNSPGDYRSHLDEAFARAEIPAYFVRGTTAPDPAGRAMLALLSCAAEGLSAKGFAEYLSLGQVPETHANKNLESTWVGPNDEFLTSVTEASATEAEGDLATSTERAESPLVADPEGSAVIEGNLRAPARWERLLVDSAVIGGKDRWTRRLQGLANELLLRIEEAAPEEEAKVESIKRQLRDLEALRAYALPLLERLAALPDGANWGEWLVHLRELAINALRYPEGVLATLADLEPMGKVGPVDLHEVQLVLGPAASRLRCKAAPTSLRFCLCRIRGLSARAFFSGGVYSWIG